MPSGSATNRIAPEDLAVDVAQSSPPTFFFPVTEASALRTLSEESTSLAKLVAVVAPTGYGKTVLLSTLFRRCMRWGAGCWWFALDERDESADRLLVFLEARLAAADAAHPPLDEVMAIYRGQEPDDERIERIVARLLRVRLPVILFIDNINCCRDPALARLLSALVFNTPPWLKLVLASTETLPLDLVRCKLEGLLTLFGVAELNFDADGVREVFGPALCARLPRTAFDIVVRYTEGWPSAVRLAQIFLSSSADPALALDNLAGTDQDIASILNAKVLNGFTAALKAFVLRLCQLRDFDYSLARIATEDPLTQGHLRYLCERNVFIIAIDGGQRHRLHNVFRGFLLDQARQDLAPAVRKQVLDRAADYCREDGRCADALDYALDGGNAALAADILEQSSPVFVRDLGYHGRYLAWVRRLHAAGEEGGWETNYWYIWALAFRRRYEQARAELARFAERLELAVKGQDRDRARLATILRRIEVIRIVIDISADHLPAVRRNAEQWLAGTDRGMGHVAKAGADSAFEIATVSCAAGYRDANAGELKAARAMVRLAAVYSAQADNAYGLGWVAAIDALIKLREGDYGVAHANLADAMASVRRTLGEDAGIYGTLALLAAKAAIEMDRKDEAQELLARGWNQIFTYGLVDTTAHGLDAALKLWSGHDGTETKVSLKKLRKIAAVYPPRLSLMLSCYLVRRLIQLGRLDEARHEAAVLDIGPTFKESLRAEVQEVYGAALGDLVQATQLDLGIALGRLKQAGAAVSDEVVRAKAEWRSGRQVELALDEAFLSHCSHRPAPARRHLMRAVALAARCRYLRPFRDRQSLIASLVNETRPRDWPFASEEERHFFTEICSGLKVGRGSVPAHAEEADGTPALSEMPTAREFQLLGFVDAGLSNQDIADRLSLSVATVKWHLYNLYAKLGVKNRVAALARARALNLLSR